MSELLIILYFTVAFLICQYILANHKQYDEFLVALMSLAWPVVVIVSLFFDFEVNND